MKITNLNLLNYQDQLKLKTIDGKRHIYDPIRAKFLVLQPEELVRQLLIVYMTKALDYPSTRIAVEQGIKVNTLARRCDILIYNQAIQPILMVECKAPKVQISETVFEQIAQYNIPLQLPYLVVTNGIDTYCCRIDHQLKEYYFLNKIPSFEAIKS